MTKYVSHGPFCTTYDCISHTYIVEKIQTTFQDMSFWSYFEQYWSHNWLPGINHGHFWKVGVKAFLFKVPSHVFTFKKTGYGNTVVWIRKKSLRLFTIKKLRPESFFFLFIFFGANLTVHFNFSRIKIYQKIVAACCVLHNHFISTNRNSYSPAIWTLAWFFISLLHFFFHFTWNWVLGLAWDFVWKSI